MADGSVKDKIKIFLQSEFDYTEDIADDLDLASNLYIDSINTIKVVLFLESNFSIQLTASDLQPKNFFQLQELERLVARKLAENSAT